MIIYDSKERQNDQTELIGCSALTDAPGVVSSSCWELPLTAGTCSYNSELSVQVDQLSLR